MRKLIKISIFLLLALASTGALSQRNLLQMDAQSAGKDSFLSKISGEVGGLARTDFKQSSDNSKIFQSEWDGRLDYRASKKSILRVSFGLVKDLTDNYEETLNDAFLTHTYLSLFNTKNYTLHLQTRVTVPTSEQSQYSDRLKTALEINPISILNLEAYVPKLTLIFIPRYKRFFNEFTTNRLGDNLVEQSLIGIGVLNYQATDQILLSSTFVYVKSRGYNGRNRADQVITSQDLAYFINDSASANVGISTGGALRDLERGRDREFNFFDDQRSQFYTGLSFIF